MVDKRVTRYELIQSFSERAFMYEFTVESTEFLEEAAVEYFMVKKPSVKICRDFVKVLRRRLGLESVLVGKNGTDVCLMRVA